MGMRQERGLRASQLLGAQVVDIAAGAALGCVRELALNPEASLVFLGLEPAAWFKPGLCVPVEAISAAAEERLLVRCSLPLENYEPAGLQRIDAPSLGQGRSLLCLDGRSLGRLSDLIFSPQSGALLMALAIDEDGTEHAISIKSVSVLGPDCLIVEASDPQAERLREERQRILRQELGSFAERALAQQVSQVEPGAADMESAPAVPDTAAEPAPLASTALAPPGQDIPLPESVEAESAGIAEFLALRAASQPPAPAPPAGPSEDPAALDAAALQRANEAWEEAAAVKDSLFPQNRTKRRLEQLSLFDQRKAQYLLGKPLRRDVYAPDGSLLCRRGRQVDDELLDAMIASGLLENVFLEMTTVTR